MREGSSLASSTSRLFFIVNPPSRPITERPRSRERSVIYKRGSRSESSEEHEDQNDHQNEAQAAAGVVTPPAAVRPGGKRTEKKKNENDNQNGTEHMALPRWIKCETRGHGGKFRRSAVSPSPRERRVACRRGGYLGLVRAQGKRSDVARQRGKKAVAPCGDVICQKRREQFLVPPFALRQGHGEGARDGAAHRIGIVRIDDQGRAQFGRGAGKARKDQHAGIGFILRRDIFLGDEIHSVTQRRHEADPR